MNNFSRLSLLMLVCAGCGLLFFGSPADLHAQYAVLEVKGDTGADRVYNVGETVETVFIAALDGLPQANVVLRITTNGIGDLRINGQRTTAVAMAMTDALGKVTITGEILVEGDFYIEAEWAAQDLAPRVDFRAREVGRPGTALTVLGDTGEDKPYDIGNEVEVIFLATLEGSPQAGVVLEITSSGIGNLRIHGQKTTAPVVRARTDLLGQVRVTGEILVKSGVFIRAEWPEMEMTAEITGPIDLEASRWPIELKLTGDTGRGKTYYIGDEIETVFTCTSGGLPQANEDLRITTNGIGDLHISNGGRTDALGAVTVTGKVLLERGSYIRAMWEKLHSPIIEAVFIAEEAGVSPALIVVVNSSDPESPLKIGDTFTQTITIENRASRFPTLPLWAWQMDIPYDPEILQVLDVTHGNFLKKDGVSTRDVEMLSPGKVSVSQSRPSLDSDENAPAPAPEGIALDPGDRGTLLTIEFKVLAFAKEALGIHNVQLLSYYMDNGEKKLEQMSYSILVKDVFVATQRMRYAKEDVNQDERINVLDLMAVAKGIRSTSVSNDAPAENVGSRADVNGDGAVNLLDLVLVYTSDLWGKAAPATVAETRDANEASAFAPAVSHNVDPAIIQSWIDLARVEDDGSALFDIGIAKLESLLAARKPNDTKLLLNYPNPFNPETWIPYQLVEATNVTVTIHAMNGSLIRTLALGHQPAGVYKSKSRAAHWDGHNEFGEQVASGLYFYTLTPGDFSATGKMLVRK